MAITMKCKMCGGDLTLTQGSTVAVCEYCGTTQTIPSADNEKKLTMFDRANSIRLACDFDRAAGIYDAIIADFPVEAEAYWGLVLCKYGIEYVDDPATGKKIPTCHRSNFDSVMDDGNFEKVLEYADVVARKVYRDEAKAIEEIRKGIIEVSGKEEPYDIFICYKETAEDGQRTLDSVLAQDVYDTLTAKGYRVFFSRITLESTLGQEYEPYIFAALNSAKVMLAFGTDYEYFNAVWVKNEWSRYLQLMTKDKSKHLIPCYKGIDAYDMPKEFAKLQAQDMGKVGAIQDLLRGIEKLLNAKEQKKQVIVSEGMTKQEKDMVNAMQKGQKRTQAMLLSTVFGMVAAALGFVVCLFAEDFYLAALYHTTMYATDFVIIRDGLQAVLFAICTGALGVSLSLNISYGLKTRAAHWINMVNAIWSSVRIVLIRNAGYVPHPALGVWLIIFMIPAAVTTLTVHKSEKKALYVHLAILVVVLVVSVIAFLY